MITVVGAGLAGSLLSLELAERGIAVRLIDGSSGATATSLSYGLLPWTAGGAWWRLQRRHGDLGLRQRWLQLGPRRLPLPALQVDARRFAAALELRLAQLGVERVHQRLDQLPNDGRPLVLACGAGCLTLAPQLGSRLRVSWAGILELNLGTTSRRLGWPTAWAQLPERFARLALERRASALEHEAWIVDAGLVPRGDQLLAGQITLIRPGLAAGPAPDAQLMERRLRVALAARWPSLAAEPGQYRQAPVSFTLDGVPLAGPCGQGLWALAGFSGAFTQLPAAAAQLANQIANEGTQQNADP